MYQKIRDWDNRNSIEEVLGIKEKDKNIILEIFDSIDEDLKDKWKDHYVSLVSLIDYENPGSLDKEERENIKVDVIYLIKILGDWNIFKVKAPWGYDGENDFYIVPKNKDSMFLFKSLVSAIEDNGESLDSSDLKSLHSSIVKVPDFEI